MSETTEPRLKIPNNYIKLHALDRATATDAPDDRPPTINADTRIKVILRNGVKNTDWARRFWWGDSANLDLNDSAIVAYRVIKLEKPWVDWGILHNRVALLERGVNNLPAIAQEGADSYPELVVWLRGSDRPTPFVRRANVWDWSLDGSSNDIMKYRLAGERDASTTRI